MRRWALGSGGAKKIECWQELEQSGTALERTMASPGWHVVETAKQYYQAQADRRMHTPGLAEQIRFQASVEWATLEAFFRELRTRVYEGNKAREALTKVTSPPAPSRSDGEMV
jgi:hypothetical protein